MKSIFLNNLLSTKNLNFIKSNLLLILFFLFLIILRFLFIDRFPAGMQYDEVEYALSSKSFQMTGKDISGTSFPASLLTTETLGRVSPVPYVIFSPLWMFFDLNMTTFRTVYVILNIITGFVFMGLVNELFKKKKITIISGILFFINPWSFFLSRHAIDGAVVLLFYLLGIWYLIKPVSIKNIIYTIIFFMLGFFSYHGAKLQLVPLIIATSFYAWHKSNYNKKYLKPHILVILIFFSSLILFLGISAFMPDSILTNRTNNILFTSIDTFSDEVVKMRTASVETPIHPFIINKLYFAVRYFFENYLNSFSPFTLFFNAEIMKYSGFFYIFDALFLMIGLFALFSRRKAEFYFLLSVILIAPLSTAISMSGFSILNRGILLLPSFLIVISYGVYFAISFFKKNIYKKITYGIVCIFYGLSFFIFLYTYFYILPVELFGHYRTPARVLSHFINFEKINNKNITIISQDPQVLYLMLTFFQGEIPKEISSKNKLINRNTFNYKIGENILITNKCPLAESDDVTYIVETSLLECGFKDYKNRLSILNKLDAGTEFFIYNAKTCSDKKLSPWIWPHYLSDFRIESLNVDVFCNRWMTK